MSWKVTGALSLALLAGCGGGDDEAQPIRAHTLVVYSSLPRTGGSAAIGNAVAAGQRLALADAHGRAGKHRVRLVELDSAEPGERDWDPDRVAENVARATDDPGTIAYLGELELGASAISLPVTNEHSILQVSPTDGLTSLTVPQSGPGAGPERFYPTERRSFLRLVPPDSTQAGPLVALAHATGAQRVALVHDDGIFGRQLTGGVQQVAENRGLVVADVERVQPDPEDASDLGRRLARERPDAVIYSGIGGDPGSTVVDAMATPGLASRPLIAASPLARRGAVRDADPQHDVEVVSPILPARLYPRSGRRILARLAHARGHTVPVEALYGYESMRFVLEAIRAAGKRAAERRAVINAARTKGPRGSVIGRYRFNARGDSTRRRLALYRVSGGRVAYEGRAPGSTR